MTDFCPVPWQEEPTPENLKMCSECGLYKHGSRMVWGEGNPRQNSSPINDGKY